MDVPTDLMSAVWAHLRNRDARPRPPLAEGRGRLKVTDHGSGGADMYIYDEIGYWGVTATDVVDQLAGMRNVSSLTVHVNSPGGDVFDGVAIYNALADHSAAVNVIVDGLAASAASFIAMAGDTVTMNRSSQMMIHDASGLCIGNATDMAAMQAMLDRTSDTIAAMYAARAGGNTASWRDLMRAETWYSAAEAVTAGLADEAASEEDEDDDVEDVAVAAHFDLTCFHYAGRDAAPDPAPAAAVVEQPVAAVFDPDLFKAAMAQPRPTFDPDLFRTRMKEAAAP